MRGKKAIVRNVLPDYKYNSVLVTKFINRTMFDGKKNTAEKQIYVALEKLAELSSMDAIVAFEKSIDNVKPKVEVRSRRVGGANYQVPVPVRDVRQQSLAIRWIVEQTRDKRSNQTFAEVLAEELFMAFKGEGNAVKKRDDVHRMAEANKAFAHLAW